MAPLLSLITLTTFSKKIIFISHVMWCVFTVTGINRLYDCKLLYRRRISWVQTWMIISLNVRSSWQREMSTGHSQFRQSYPLFSFLFTPTNPNLRTSYSYASINLRQLKITLENQSISPLTIYKLIFITHIASTSFIHSNALAACSILLETLFLKVYCTWTEKF